MGLYITMTTVPVSIEEIFDLDFNPYRHSKNAAILLSAWDHPVLCVAETAKYFHVDNLNRYFADEEMISEGWWKLKEFFQGAWGLIASDKDLKQFTVGSIVLVMEKELCRLKN